MDGQAIEPVEFTYSGGDVLILNLVIWRFWVTSILVIAVFMCSLSVGLLLFDGLDIRQAIIVADWAFTWKLVLVLAAWILIVSLLSNWWRARQESTGRITVALTPEGIKIRSRRMDGLVFWSAIKSLKVRFGRVFFFLTRRMAVIVPRRAFASDADFDAFAAAAREAWEHRQSP
jgi:hypothetical protein